MSESPAVPRDGTALTVSELRIEIAGGVVVDGVSLELAPGECLAIVGESGSGKTMTANALLGLSPASARVTVRELRIAGVDTSGFGERDWRRLRGRAIGLVSQDAMVSLDPLRRVGREVAEPLEVHEGALGRDAIARRVVQLLDRVAVDSPLVRAGQYPHELSGGLRQRALIASALAAGPGLLVADEPTTALDATVQAQIIGLFEELRDSGIAIVLISHDLAVVRRIADRVAVMRAGRIVEQGRTARVFEAPEHPYTRELLAATPTPRAPRTSDGAVVLSATDLQKRYTRPGGGQTVALDGVGFELRAGRTLGVVGESGSGKSTLARTLLGESPDAGVVLLRGRAWSSLGERQRRGSRSDIQLIEQDSFAAFDPRFTVARIVGEAVALSDTPRRDRRARVAELLGQVGLGVEVLGRRARQLSGGQRQRVAIARALARRPGILVCDEPVSALDVSVQAQILSLLESLQDTLGLSMVFVSHDLAVIAQMSDEILVMRRGVVVEHGAASEVLSAPQQAFTRELLRAASMY